ncbi:MAG: hypothetical protein GX548_07420 [Lentisphaerae bacterium]|nr:hypothetical protein [Lentisphaerota bacterium]
MNTVSSGKQVVLGIQMLFVAFGALVLVPLLTGLDPSVALFTAGAGTLLFHALTGGSVPIFLASSFAFIAPIQFAMKEYGPGATHGALFCAGYVVALIMGLVDFTPIREAAWFRIPWVVARESGAFAMPRFDPAAILYMLPVALAPAIEHVGDILAISSVTGRNYLKQPGLHRTLLGDGLATSLAALLGGPPNTTYSEVTGAVALTKATDPRLMRIAAVTAILLAFAGKLGAVLRTIPGPVMGGIMLLLFGMIAAIGVNSLVKARVDMSRPRNLVIASVILTAGIGDMTVTCGRFCLGGIGLAGLVGVLLNLLLPGTGDAHAEESTDGDPPE